MQENKNKKRPFKHAYVKDFKPDESGKYTYSGKILTSTTDLLALRSGILTAVAIFGAVLVLQLVAGFLPGTGMEGHILMLLPYALGLAANVRILWILVRTLRHMGQETGQAGDAGRAGQETGQAGDAGRAEQETGQAGDAGRAGQETGQAGDAGRMQGKLREYVYEATVKKLPDYLVAVQIFAGTALFDVAVCMIRGNYETRMTSAIVFLLSQLLLFAAGAWVLRRNPVGEWN